jgi:hypothetical protein
MTIATIETILLRRSGLLVKKTWGENCLRVIRKVTGKQREALSALNRHE